LLDWGGAVALGACVLAGLVAFGGGHLAVAAFGPGLAASLVLGLTLLAGCLTGWRTGASLDLSRPRRWAWRLIAAGLATVLVAQLAAAALDFAGLMAPARRAGLFRIGFYPLVAIACILLIRSNRQATPRVRFWLDSLAVSLSFGAMLWFFLLDPMLSEAGPAAALAIGPALYTLLDATAFLLAALVLLGRPGRARSPAAAWLAAGLATLLAADVAAAGAGSAGDLVLLSKDGLFVVAYALFAVAAHADWVHAETAAGAAPQDETPPHY